LINLVRIHASIALIAFSLSVLAQQPATVGDLVDKGGKKLNQEEATKVLTGATVKGTSFNDPRYIREYTHKSDGSLSGTAGPSGEKQEQYEGKWWVTESGQLCVDRKRTSATNYRRYCGSYFVFANEYFEAANDDRASPIFVRTIKR